MFNLGPWEIIAILLVVVLIFGGKKLRSLGSDIGAPISEPSDLSFFPPKIRTTTKRMAMISHGPKLNIWLYYPFYQQL